MRILGSMIIVSCTCACRGLNIVRLVSSYLRVLLKNIYNPEFNNMNIESRVDQTHLEQEHIKFKVWTFKPSRSNRASSEATRSFTLYPVADPDLELRGTPVLICLPCWPFSLQSFLLFLPKIRGAGPPGPSPRCATGTVCDAINLDISRHSWVQIIELG